MRKKPKLANNNIRMSVDLAEAMRHIAQADRKYIGVVWEEAARAYLAERLDGPKRAEAGQ